MSSPAARAPMPHPQPHAAGRTVDPPPRPGAGRTPRRALAGWAAASALLIGAVVPAGAATIGINGSILTATADAGDDVLLAVLDGGALQFFGVAFVVVTPGCSDLGGSTSCQVAGLTELRINLGAGDDVLDLSGLGTVDNAPAAPPLEILVLGGDGDDVLLGSAGNFNNFFGGAGDDVLIGVDGVANCLNGGAGDNIVINGNPTQRLCSTTEPDFPPARPTGVPEPATALMATLGLLGLARLSRRAGPARVTRGIAAA